MPNKLYFGDNLEVLRDQVANESVDLIYLDPPFNSNRSYNVLFRDEGGSDSEAQITAFEDSWHWNETAEATFRDLVQDAPPNVSKMINALRDFIGTNQMLAYLVMMTARLVELHRVLKPTGSLYLHCDPAASHYLKVILDAIFGPENFRNEIIWKRSQPKSHITKRFSRAHDVILFYAKSERAAFYPQFMAHDETYLDKFYKHADAETGRRYQLDNLLNPNRNRPNLTYEFPPGSGTVRVWRWTKDRMQREWEAGRVILPKTGGVVRYKRYLDEMEGSSVTDIWADIEHLHGSQQEFLGYPTQKPVALLERIIKASSKEGDIILDPFAGCGTAVIAAESLKRQWIGIDITAIAIKLVRERLNAMNANYDVYGFPRDLDSARKLAQDSAHDGRYQFQFWALAEIGAKPTKQGKKGMDRGIDGMITFVNEKTARQEILVSVKSGHVTSSQVRDLRGVIERENAAMGIFITLDPPTREMRTEAVSAGYYELQNHDPFPRLQIVTIEDLLAGRLPRLPSLTSTYRRGKVAELGARNQPALFDVTEAPEV